MRLSKIRQIISENINVLNYKPETCNQGGHIAIRDIPPTVNAIDINIYNARLLNRIRLIYDQSGPTSQPFKNLIKF